MKILALVFTLLVACRSADKQTLYYTTDNEDVVLENLQTYWMFDCSFPDDLKDSVRAGFDEWSFLAFNFETVDPFIEVSYCFDSEKYIRPRDMIVVDYIDGCRIDSFNETFSYNCNTLAVAYRSFNYDVTRITGGTIRFYAPWATHAFPGRVNVSKHEVGHILGLEHSDDSPHCVMFPTLVFKRSSGVNDERYFHIERQFCKREVYEFLKNYGNKGNR